MLLNRNQILAHPVGLSYMPSGQRQLGGLILGEAQLMQLV